MKIFAYEGMQMVLIAQPFICKYNFKLNTKFLSVSMSDKNVIIIMVGMIFFGIIIIFLFR